MCRCAALTPCRRRSSRPPLSCGNPGASPAGGRWSTRRRRLIPSCSPTAPHWSSRAVGRPCFLDRPPPPPLFSFCSLATARPCPRRLTPPPGPLARSAKRECRVARGARRVYRALRPHAHLCQPKGNVNPQSSVSAVPPGPAPASPSHPCVTSPRPRPFRILTAAACCASASSCPWRWRRAITRPSRQRS